MYEVVYIQVEYHFRYRRISPQCPSRNIKAFPKTLNFCRFKWRSKKSACASLTEVIIYFRDIRSNEPIILIKSRKLGEVHDTLSECHFDMSRNDE
jgi:hypothetical protein